MSSLIPLSEVSTLLHSQTEAISCRLRQNPAQTMNIVEIGHAGEYRRKKSGSGWRRPHAARMDEPKFPV